MQKHLTSISVIVVTISILGIFLAIYTWMTYTPDKVLHIDMKYPAISQSDTAKFYKVSKLQIDSLKSLTKTLSLEIKNLESTKEQIIKIRSEENFYTKIFTSVIAIIITLGTFFGFKSIIELKSSAEEKAKLEAQSQAKKTTRLYFNRLKLETKTEIISIYREAITKEISDQTKELYITINSLKEEIDRLKNPTKFSQSTEPQSTEDTFEQPKSNNESYDIFSES